MASTSRFRGIKVETVDCRLLAHLGPAVLSRTLTHRNALLDFSALEPVYSVASLQSSQSSQAAFGQFDLRSIKSNGTCLFPSVTYICVGFPSIQSIAAIRQGQYRMNSATPLTPVQSTLEAPFVDRRQQLGTGERGERRQFGNSYYNLSPEGRQLAEAIDAYKVDHHRRYITTDELLGVLGKLGYKQSV